MQSNVARQHHVQTAGGAPAVPHLTPIQQLRRSVLSCLLWEDEFYESGQEIGARIETLAAQVSQAELAALAVEARTVHNLRHVSLVLLCALAKRGGPLVSATMQKQQERRGLRQVDPH